jgi:hypothetical protein
MQIDVVASSDIPRDAQDAAEMMKITEKKAIKNRLEVS